MRRIKGFSLIELSVVLIIIALLVSSGLSLLNLTLDRESHDRTVQRLDMLQETLKSYALSYGYLPCPADITASTDATAYGTGTGTGAGAISCTAANFTTGNTRAGMVPTKTLGLDDIYGVDGWGSRILYAVDARLTVSGAATTYPLGSAVGTLTVRDETGGDRTTVATYVLVSHGINAHGGYPVRGGATRRSSGSTNASEQENCECDATGAATAYDVIYIERETTGDTEALTSFDDIVRYAVHFDMQNPYSR